MANAKNIASAFLDGLGSLGFLFEPAIRPGSRENLISQAAPPTFDKNFVREAVLRRSEDIDQLVIRLRQSADAIESQQQVLRQGSK